MPEPAQPAPPKAPGSFANLLASFAGKLHNDPWDDSALADDVTTISYEQALNAGHRDLPRSATNSLLDDTPAPASIYSSVEKTLRNSGPKKPKSASITIRVTAEEQAQLHQRANAAQLSVSAYLRSCIFEAESLRTQVKEAVAKMQSAPSTASLASTNKTSVNWRKRVFPNWFRGSTAET